MVTTSWRIADSRALHERTCPVCGTTAMWAWHPVKHVVGEDVIWHMKGRFGGKVSGEVVTMASLLLNGKRVEV
jgi:hypothetical protein